MFRALNAHFQEDTLYTCSIWYCHSRRQWQYHMLLVYNLSSWRWAFKARTM